MENPFLFGKAVAGNAFINRTREIKDLTEALSQGQSVILFSPRRYGKTSLVNKVLSELGDKGMLRFYIDLYRITSLEKFYTDYSNCIIKSIKSPADKVFALIRDLLPSIKPKIVLKDLGAQTIELEVGTQVLRKSTSLQELFNSLESYCTAHHKKACIIFDEFQEIKNMPDSDLLEREMRSAFQHHQNVSYAFCGSQHHLMQDIFMDKSRPFYKFGMHYELDVIERVHWQKHIVAVFKLNGKQISPEVCEEILNYSQGHPYYTQLLCRQIWAASASTSVITGKDVKKALTLSIQMESHAFNEIWDTLKMKERHFLKAIAQEGQQEIFSSDFVHKFNLGAISTLQQTVARLVRRGLIMKRNKKYCLTDPLFKEWLKL